MILQYKVGEIVFDRNLVEGCKMVIHLYIMQTNRKRHKAWQYLKAIRQLMVHWQKEPNWL